MNFLCLSDLHLRAKDVVDAFEHDRLSVFMSQVKSGVARASSDVVPTQFVTLLFSKMGGLSKKTAESVSESV